MIFYQKEIACQLGGVRKTTNSHSSLHCCGCSCILSCYMIILGRQDIQILLMFVKDFFLKVAQKKGRTKRTHQIAGFETMM